MTFASNSSGQPRARRHDARALCLLLAIATLVAACSESNDLPATSGYSLEVAEEIETPFPKLTELLRSVPVAVIDLDDLPQPITIEPEVIIGGESVTDSDTLFLAEPWGAVNVGDSVVIIDRVHETLFLADLEGRLMRRVGRSGEGPGEFSEIGLMAASDEHLFVYNNGTYRVQVFNHELEYQTSIPIMTRPMPSTTLAVRNDKFYVANLPAGEWMVSGYSTTSPFSHKIDLFPRIVPLENRERSAHNSVLLAAETGGMICGEYAGLATILCYDEDKSPGLALVFQGERVDRLDRGLPEGTFATGTSVTRLFTRSMVIIDHVLYLLLGRSLVGVDLEEGHIAGVLALPDDLSPFRLSSTQDYLAITSIQTPQVWLFSHDHVHSQLTKTD